MIKVILLICTSILFSASILAKDIYVSTQGSDELDGSEPLASKSGTHGPFLTLHKAQLAVRDFKRTSLQPESITVHIEAGTYTLEKPLQFDIRDSGTIEYPITWRAEKDKVALSGGTALKNCMNQKQGLWRCFTAGKSLENVRYNNSRKQGNAPEFDLYIDNKQMTLARWPNNEWAHIGKPINKNTSFISLEELPNVPGFGRNIQAHIFPGNDWYDQYLPIKSLENSTNTIILSAPTTYQIESGRRFYIENDQSLMDIPGEWFFNEAEKTISFIHSSVAIPKEIEVSSLENILLFKGASYINFQNIEVKFSTESAISIDQSKNITFDFMNIHDTGSNAILAKNSKAITISNTHIYNTGEISINLSGGNRTILESSEYVVDNNYIHHFGRSLLTNSPAVLLSGVGTKVTNNKIAFGAGNSIVIEGNDHLIEKNEIYNVCEQASDCGAIYSGRDWSYRGNIVRHNYIHDIYGYGLSSLDITNKKVVYSSPNGARGIYLDDAASGFLIYGNILNNAGQMAIQIGGGRDNIIKNNIVLSNNSYSIWMDDRWPEFNWSTLKTNLKRVPFLSKPWSSKYPTLSLAYDSKPLPEGNIIDNNIFISKNNSSPIARYTTERHANKLSNNIYWNSFGNKNIVDFKLLNDKFIKKDNSWSEWSRAGIETDSFFAKPCIHFINNQITFCESSPIKPKGFEPIPFKFSTNFDVQNWN